ncbi:NAD(P)-binding protein [Neocallimastix californiae]|uniref:D-xylose 1-dehydrogenase (NADP(+), D-xylono-1,5-lactone-forming) n=1 Tax=Neocallimastix californiae TaxID=1754190 RepID=A0A1Y1ZFE5_9FUNG|nr:NAD(P)-binding protein [Neocallimastix californiae]|eukprot:ORY08978.1 NAD(P)-binding protein [Neocallimastix californiae]
MGVKWGIMGTAGICHWGTIPGMLKSKNSELYAIAGRSQEKVDAYMKEFGIQKDTLDMMLFLADPEVQAVYIPLPNHIHCEWVIKALEAKKAPYAYLHSQYVQSLKMDVRSGIIGDIDFIDTAFITQGYKEDIRLHKEFGGGAMYDLGCYCTTLILSLVDSDVETVHASGLNFASGARASFTVVSVYNNYALEFDQFNACIMNGEKPLITEEFSLKICV